MPNTSRKNKWGFLETIDAFHQPIKIYFEGDTKHKTIFGGLITLILIGILLALIISQFMQLINRSGVDITTQTDHILHPPKLTLDEHDFRFVIMPDNLQLNYSLFSYTASITNSTYSTPILLKPCLQSDFSDFEEQYKQFGLNEGICSAVDEIDIQGIYGDSNFAYLQLAVVKCINGTTPGVTCAPQSYIDNYFMTNNKVWMGLYFTNPIFKPFNYENPYQLYLEVMPFYVSSLGKLVREVYLYLGETTVNSISNIAGIGDGINITKNIFSNERFDDFYVPLENEISYLKLNILSSKNVVTYFRKYSTLDDILSEVYGILYIWFWDLWQDIIII